MAKKLKIGDMAPRFWMRDVKGGIVNLDAHSPDYTLIAFLRYSGCPWCNLAIHRLTMEQNLLKQSKCQVVAFIQSSKENILKNIYDRHAKSPDFSVIADPECEVYKKYAVSPSLISAVKQIKHAQHWVHAVKEEGYGQKSIDGNLFLAPAMFLVDHNLRIIRADYNANLYDHETFTEVYESLSIKI